MSSAPVLAEAGLWLEHADESADPAGAGLLDFGQAAAAGPYPARSAHQAGKPIGQVQSHAKPKLRLFDRVLH